MNKFLITTIAIAALASGGVAAAADLEVKAPERHHCGGAFQGFYIGINGGGATHTATRTDQESFLNPIVPAAATYVQGQTGPFGGAQIGYNYQCNNMVFGLEVDGDWLHLSRTTRVLGVADPTFTNTLTNRVDDVVTGRIRAGVVANESFLLYATGGVASARFRTTWSVVDNIFGTTDAAQLDERVWGWVAGVGAEWAFFERFTVRAEALYMDFGQRDLTFTTPNFPGPANVSHADSIFLARLGLNVKLTNW